MLTIPGRPVRTCEGWSRRELLRVGGAGLLGLNLPEFLSWKAMGAPAKMDSPNKAFGAAKSVIMVYLQGGPSHLDLWDPKPDAPDNIRGDFKPINTKVSGHPGHRDPAEAGRPDRQVHADPLDELHAQRPVQPHGRHLPDDDRLHARQGIPSGQLEPPAARLPELRLAHLRLKPPEEPMLPFVELPRPLQESNVVGKGGTAGFLGKAYDPYPLYQDPNKELKIDDLSLRPEVSPERLKDRSALLNGINGSMPDLDKAVSSYALNEYYAKALDLVLSGQGARRVRPDEGAGQGPRPLRPHHVRPERLLARRLIEAGTRVVEVNWPKVANGIRRPLVGHARRQLRAAEESALPDARPALSALIADLDQRGLLDETLVVAPGEFGRSPQMGVSTSGNGNAADGRDHWPYCYTAVVAGAGIKRGVQYGKSDDQGSSPLDKPVHPTELLATIYHALGIDPAMVILNHLNQPRELVKGEPLLKLFG